MQVIKKIITTPSFIRTAVILVVVLVLIILARIFSKRYNKGYSRVNLIISRVCLVAFWVIFIFWIWI